MADSLPPPTYSQGDPPSSDGVRTLDTLPQILLVPPANLVNFQKGYLGAEGENAAIEGELQIKGAKPGCWSKVTISLRTCETAYLREIELAFSQLVLFNTDSGTSFPSTLPFSLPLTSDTPQSIQTPHSSLSHTLTATLFPSDRSLSSCSKSIVVHTRRYMSHSFSLFASPETFALNNPTRVELEIPRATFKVGEPIPLYVTVPPPSRELVIDQGLRLRNVRAELVRVIKVKREDGDYEVSDSDEESHSVVSESLDEPTGGPSTEQNFANIGHSKVPPSPLFLGSSYRTTIAQSGASCRFHTSRAIKLRLLLHQPPANTSPSRYQPDLPTLEYRSLGCDAESASITQSTLLHTVTFRIHVHVSFVDMSTHTERVSHLSIPILILPPSAPLPEIGPSLDEAYQKKHDRPPARTVRYEDIDLPAPYYPAAEAGPSYMTVGAPPPFEERDAPPPFSSTAAEASTSARLPTFLESESEIIFPETDHSELLQHISQSPYIVGEGTDFGFSAAEQFDGHAEDMHRSATPPPTMEMATHDTDLTALTEIHQSDRGIEALGLAIDHDDNLILCDDQPPPPPAIDDPLDPPPSIDSEFRSPEQVRRVSPRTSPPMIASYHPIEPPSLPLHSPSDDIQLSHGHAPPPYLIPELHSDHEQVMRPPPYAD
ncbi:hypothetical protein AMATHDRAFT_134807 [Amanita thiersii Skay4041]|uniref:Uncharacterized protein n=1 Tax=Amanita thiersii Skay4041 TaxID=703135 RepID=A0A2A9NYE5_9AGAR|nr:hypothetical protein AMATHDRAFT_134807 [Amanita thiersii Skay4041]